MFVLPASARALRPAGVEDSSLKVGLEQALAAGAEEKPASRRKWTMEKVLSTIRRAAASKRPKLSLAPGAIHSQSQRSSDLGAELFHAYQAVVTRKSFPDDLPDWPAALRRAGEDPADHYRRRFSAGAEERSKDRSKWTVEKVLEVIRRASASKRPQLSLAPGAIQSQSQRGSALGAELYHAYQAVVGSKSFPDDLPDWPAALRRAGEDPEKICRPYEFWTVKKVLSTIRRASASERPKLSLAPGAIHSQSQRSSDLGAELYRAYAAVVGSKSFPKDLPDWPAALRRAGEDPADHYQRRRFAAGVEEMEVERSLAIAREAIRGAGVVVIDVAIFPQQAGSEELLKRLPVENRIVVVGAMEGSAAMQEIWARNTQIRFADSLESAVPLILSLPAADTVSILATEAFAQALQADLRQFMVEVFQIDHRLGLSVLLLALGVPEEVLRQLDWESVDSALKAA